MFQKRPADQFARGLRIAGSTALALCVVTGLLLAVTTLIDAASTSRALEAWQMGVTEIAARGDGPRRDAAADEEPLAVAILRRIAIFAIALLVLSPAVAYAVLPSAYWHFGERGFAALSLLQIVVLLLSAAPFLLAVVGR